MKWQCHAKIIFVRLPPCLFSLLEDCNSTLHISIRILKHFIKTISIVLIILEWFRICSLNSLCFFFVNPSFLFKLSFQWKCFINCFSISINYGIYCFVIIVDDVCDTFLYYCCRMEWCSQVDDEIPKPLEW